MYILTQDKKKIKEFAPGGTVEVERYEDASSPFKVYVRPISGYSFCIGGYKTEKRAIDEMISFAHALNLGLCFHKVLDDDSDTDQNACEAPEE